MCTPCVRLSCGMRAGRSGGGGGGDSPKGRAFGERSGAGRGTARGEAAHSDEGRRGACPRVQRPAKGGWVWTSRAESGEAVPRSARSARRGAFASRASVAGRSAVAERGRRGAGRGPLWGSGSFRFEHLGCGAPAGPAAPGGAARSEGPRRRQRAAQRRSTPFPSGAPARAGRDPPPRLHANVRRGCSSCGAE